MARYIDADKIVFWIKHVSSNGMLCDTDVRKVAFSDEIARMPTADVVEVVRCKDCVFCSPETPISNRCLMTNECVDKLHFCSHGERKK